MNSEEAIYQAFGPADLKDRQIAGLNTVAKELGHEVHLDEDDAGFWWQCVCGERARTAVPHGKRSKQRAKANAESREHLRWIVETSAP